MNENRYAVGIDVGTGSVRVVIGAVSGAQGADAGDSSRITIVGVGEQPSKGMRKGKVVDINEVAAQTDKALAMAERMSGLEISEALVGINGTQNIEGMPSRGLITVNQSRPIGGEEIDRVVDAAAQVKLKPNYEIISVEPHIFRVDNQDGVRDPIDMTGVRLEVDAYMITAMVPHIKNLDQAMERASLKPIHPYVPAGAAAADLALSSQQKENGSVLVDIGHSVTNVVVYEEGDLIDIKVLPVGSNDLTRDLATILKCDLDVAEKIKLEYAVAAPALRRGKESKIGVRMGENGPKREFETKLIDEIAEDRLSELFELVNDELKSIHRAGNLPGGAVLTGGGAKLRGIADLAREVLNMNTKIYAPQGYGGIAERVKGAEWTTALGLLNLAAENDVQMIGGGEQRTGGGLLDKILGNFRHK